MRQHIAAGLQKPTDFAAWTRQALLAPAAAEPSRMSCRVEGQGFGSCASNINACQIFDASTGCFHLLSTRTSRPAMLPAAQTATAIRRHQAARHEDRSFNASSGGTTHPVVIVIGHPGQAAIGERHDGHVTTA